MDSTTSFEKQSQQNKFNKFLGYGFVWLLIIGFVEAIPMVLGESASLYHYLAIGMLGAAVFNFRTAWKLYRARETA